MMILSFCGYDEMFYVATPSSSSHDPYWSLFVRVLVMQWRDSFIRLIYRSFILLNILLRYVELLRYFFFLSFYAFLSNLFIFICFSCILSIWSPTIVLRISSHFPHLDCNGIVTIFFMGGMDYHIHSNNRNRLSTNGDIE